MSTDTGTPQKWIFSALFLVLVCTGSAFIGLGLGEKTRHVSLGMLPHNDIKVFGKAPDFSLTERSGEKFSSKRLSGKPWVADFIFTNCAGQCPMMSASMKKLQTLFPRETGVHFVSFSVDPSRDTPAVLSKYADRYQAEKNRWFFLTGEKEEINRILSGFLLSHADEPAMHSSRFILVDGEGQIRGFYDTAEAPSMTRLVQDAKVLLKNR